MISRLSRMIIALAAACLPVTAPAGAGEDAAARKALVIMLDGARADMGAELALPAFARLRSAASLAPGYKTAWSNNVQCIPDAPAISGPNHAAIATGVTAAKHGVRRKGEIAKGNFAEWPLAISRIKRRFPGLRVSFAYNWAEDADFPLAEGIEATRGHDGEQAKALAARLRAGEMDVAQFFIGALDGAGHTEGFYPFSDRYKKAAASVDKMIDDLCGAIVARPSFAGEDWLVIVCADHGGEGRQHSSGTPGCRTTEMLIIGRRMTPGRIPGELMTTDVAATLLNHFGITAAGLDGVARGR